MAHQYQHILLATDFSPEAEHVINRTQALHKNHGCKLSIIHVMEPISIAYGGEFPVDLGDLHKELQKQATDNLDGLGERLNVPKECRYLEIGVTEKEIIRLANEQEVDLIILGSHGRHGLQLLLGSTANGVLHHANCDVLAVRVQNE